MSLSQVFFDDMMVVVTESKVVQKDSYYPFGLSFNSYQRVTNEPNRFKYNGKEEITDLGVNWYDYGARMYIPEIGRWNGIDANQEGTLYKGYSENIIQRGEAHNNGLRKYTAGKGPWKLVFVKSLH